jgi:hypothetical protein
MSPVSVPFEWCDDENRTDRLAIEHESVTRATCTSLS